MNILILQETDWNNGFPAQQHHLAEILSIRGHEVTAIDFDLNWRKRRRKGLLSRREVVPKVNNIYQNAGVKLVRPAFLRIPGLDYVSLLFSHTLEIKRQIKEFKPDVIVGFGIISSLTATWLNKRTSIPFVYYWIDVLHLLIPEKIFSGLGKSIETAALRRSDKVLMINENLKDLVITLGAPVGKTQVIKAGIDINKFDLNIDGDFLRKQYGIDENDVVLFFMGNLYPFAGLKETALKLAESANKYLKFLVVGDGDAYADLKKIQDEYKLKDRIILAGKKPYQEIPYYIAAADICLLPSYPWEPIMQDIVPIKLYEYMAMKKPVISTKLPGVMREFGSDNGIIFVEKPDDIVDKAVELISSNRLEDLGAKARKFAERNSWDKITDEFEKILHEVIIKRKLEKHIARRSAQNDQLH